MNPIGLGRHAEVFVHSPSHTTLHTTLEAALQEQRKGVKASNTPPIQGSSESEKGKPGSSRTRLAVSSLVGAFTKSKSLVSPIFLSPRSQTEEDTEKESRVEGKNPNEKTRPPPTDSTINIDTNINLTVPDVRLACAKETQRGALRLGDLDAVPLRPPALTNTDHINTNNNPNNNNNNNTNKLRDADELHRAHLLNFDLLRFAVFATTETIQVEEADEEASFSPPRCPSRHSYVFDPEPIVGPAAQSIVEAHLGKKIASTCNTLIERADKNLVAKMKISPRNKSTTTARADSENEKAAKVKREKEKEGINAPQEAQRSESSLSYLRQVIRNQEVFKAVDNSKSARSANTPDEAVSNGSDNEEKMSPSQRYIYDDLPSEQGDGKDDAVVIDMSTLFSDEELGEETRKDKARAAEEKVAALARLEARLRSEASRVVRSEWRRPATKEERATDTNNQKGEERKLVRVIVGHTNAIDRALEMEMGEEAKEREKESKSGQVGSAPHGGKSAEPQDAHDIDLPYSVHFFGDGVGRRVRRGGEKRCSENLVGDENIFEGPVVVTAPSPATLRDAAAAVIASSTALESQASDASTQIVDKDMEIASHLLARSLPTITDLSCLSAVHVSPVVVRLFREATVDKESGQQAFPPRAAPFGHHHKHNIINHYDNDEESNEKGFYRDGGLHPAVDVLESGLEGSAGGAKLLAQQWSRVERALMSGCASSSLCVGSPYAHTATKNTDNGSTPLLVSDGGYLRSNVTERPSWVKSLVASLVKEIAEKQKMHDNAAEVADATMIRAGRGCRGGSRTPPATHSRGKRRSYVRVKFLCFVPFVICHPTYSRRLNILYHPIIVNATDNSNDRKEGTLTENHSELFLSEDTTNRAALPSSSVVLTAAQSDSTPTIPSRRVRDHCFPRALLMSPTLRSSSLSASTPPHIATIESIFDDLGFVVGIVPKYGS